MKSQRNQKAFGSVNPASPDLAPPEFALIETMLLKGGRLRFFPEHLDRAQLSAEVLAFRFSRSAAADFIGGQIGELGGAYKVRILFWRDGRMSCQSSPLEGGVKKSFSITFADKRVDENDVLVRHKTTRRDHLERARVEAEAAGFDEVVFVNSRGDVTECCNYNLLARFGSSWVTPPLKDGLLPGLMRARLLKASRVVERTISRDELFAADEVALCNSVRGVRRSFFKK